MEFTITAKVKDSYKEPEQIEKTIREYLKYALEKVEMDCAECFIDVKLEIK